MGHDADKHNKQLFSLQRLGRYLMLTYILAAEVPVRIIMGDDGQAISNMPET
ncbi:MULTISPECIES: hypothetical protein [unclassified Rhizobium]|uniref:hypothetical protein n=1 Tax=unclassified Rhizobium TaxID=2613769 RepID=UPI0013C4C46D|nr:MULTISPECIES: hypothetical protein [unclassified Rhizobium]